MLKLKRDIYTLACQEIESLKGEEIASFFHAARRWDLTTSLLKGGSIIFPHTLVRTCGDQIAGAVQACLRSRAKRVIALGVLHGIGQGHIAAAREKAEIGIDISTEKCRGVFGPFFSTDLSDDTWKTEYSLLGFTFLWNYAIKQQHIPAPPELIHAYVCLSNNEPWNLPGIEKLKSYLPESVTVATTDFCHHGVAYQTLASEVLPRTEKSKLFASTL